MLGKRTSFLERVEETTIADRHQQACAHGATVQGLDLTLVQHFSPLGPLSPLSRV